MCNMEAINESEKVLDKKFQLVKRAEQRYRKQIEKHIETIKNNRNTQCVEKICKKLQFVVYVYDTSL